MLERMFKPQVTSAFTLAESPLAETESTVGGGCGVLVVEDDPG